LALTPDPSPFGGEGGSHGAARNKDVGKRNDDVGKTSSFDRGWFKTRTGLRAR
jgi:hypothetical protein